MHHINTDRLTSFFSADRRAGRDSKPGPRPDILTGDCITLSPCSATTKLVQFLMPLLWLSFRKLTNFPYYSECAVLFNFSALAWEIQDRGFDCYYWRYWLTIWSLEMPITCRWLSWWGRDQHRSTYVIRIIPLIQFHTSRRNDISPSGGRSPAV